MGTHTTDDHSAVATAAKLLQLEEEVAFLGHARAQLDDALVDKEMRIQALEERVRLLEAALARLAERPAPSGGDRTPYHPEFDPVPRSG